MDAVRSALWELLEGLDPREPWLGFLVAARIGLALALTALDPGPSRGLAPPLRLLFWLAHSLIPIALMELAQIGLGRVRRLDAASPWGRVGIAGLLGAAAFAPVALALDRVFPLPDAAADRAGLLPELAAEVAAFAPPMLLVWLGLNAPRLLRLAPPPTVAAAQQAPGGAEHNLWSRTPRRLGRDLVALSAELHYLRIVTTAGEALILFPFGRALPLVAATPGLRIHRSHWVALGHVTEVRRAGERVTAMLSTGRELPVNHAYRAELRAALAAR